MEGILVGGIAIAELAVALFFLRFWRETRDRFFLFFALAFTIEGIHRLAVYQLVGPEVSPEHYLPRLLAYGLIIVAIVDKNRGPRP